MARFQAGSRTLVIKWVARPTRKLHSAADCYRGAGYRLTYLPLKVDADGRQWAGFEARKQDELVVREAFFSVAGDEQWADVSTWYWAALFGKSTGPWWAYTVTKPKR